MQKNLSIVALTLLVVASICIIKTSAVSEVRARNAAGTDLDQAIVSKSKEVWEAYKSRNIAAMKALTAADYAAFTQSGPSNLQQDIATIDKLKIESYTLDEAKVSGVTKDVAILRYKCNLKGSFDGKPFKPVYATEVWVNRDGKWVITSYSETLVG